MRQFKRYTMLNSLAAIVLLLVFAALSMERFRAAAVNDTEEDLATGLRLFRTLLAQKGNGFRIEDGKLWVGNYLVNGNFEVPDKVSELTGDTATIFMGDERVSTNVTTPNGVRAVGTRLDGPARRAIFQEGKPFRGEALILGVPYLTAYEPIHDRSGKIIGALYVGMKKSDFLNHYNILRGELALIMLGLLAVFLAQMILVNSLVKKAEKRHEADFRFLQTLIDSIPNPVFYKDANGKYLGCNNAYQQFIGLAREQVVGKTVRDIAPPQLAERYERADRELFDNKGVQVYESTVWDAAGTPHEVLFSKAIFPGPDGAPAGLIGSLLDISERKRMEERLRVSERKLADIIEFYPDATMVIDNAGVVVSWNRAMEELSGVKAKEMIGKGDYEYALPFYGVRRPVLVDLVNRPWSELEIDYPLLERRGDILVGEAYLKKNTGQEFYFHGTAAPLRDATGKVIGAIESIRDITVRKKAEEALASNEHQLAGILDAVGDGICMLDDQLTVVRVNPFFETYYADRRPLVGKKCYEVFMDRSEPCDHCPSLATIESGKPASKMFTDRRHGREFCFELVSFPIFDPESNTVTGVVEHVRDITERRAAEERLHRFSLAVEQSAASIVITDTRGTIEYVNPSFCWITGYSREEAVGKSPSVLKSGQTDPAVYAQLWRTITSGREWQGEFHNKKKNGEFFWESARISPITDATGVVTGYLAIKEDITARKTAEQDVRRLTEELEKKVEERTAALVDAQKELVRKEKLAILGQLSGSIGHELRNPLGVMNNAVYYLKMVLPDADQNTREYLDIIKSEIDNSQRIITDLLDFARTSPPRSRPTAVRQLIDETLAKCRLPAAVEVCDELPADLPMLRVDPLQTGQVLQNLVTNALQAMEAGGVLKIGARRAGDFVDISVADTGDGIPGEYLERIFQPLFTTKAKGIGLGLVVSKNLTEANGGSIRVLSRQGEGTVFTVSLPVEA